MDASAVVAICHDDGHMTRGSPSGPPSSVGLPLANPPADAAYVSIFSCCGRCAAPVVCVVFLGNTRYAFTIVRQENPLNISEAGREPSDLIKYWPHGHFSTTASLHLFIYSVLYLFLILSALLFSIWRRKREYGACLCVWV